MHVQAAQAVVNTAIIIVHGTWAAQHEWHKPDGQFCKSLLSRIQECKISSFIWSGKFDRNERVYAAKNLSDVINQIPQHIKVILIGHSHGGNVALLASHASRRLIDHIVLLGTPIMPAVHVPHTEKYGFITNIFSAQDKIQAFALTTQRTVDWPRSCNIRLQGILGIEFDHPGLHAPVVALAIPKFLTVQDKQPRVAIFAPDKEPILSMDEPQRNVLMDHEQECELDTDTYTITQQW